MILRSRGSNVELRSTGPFGDTTPPPWSRFSAMYGTGTSRVNAVSAVSIPAIKAAMRLIAENVASLPLLVRDGMDPLAPVSLTSWQHKLFAQPSLDGTRFNLISDIAASVEGYGNSFVQKVKDRGRVVELLVLQPDFIQVKRRNGVKTFDVKDPETNRVTSGLTSADILHIRGFTVDGSYSGLSPFGLHRSQLANTLAVEEFRGNYFANDATPNGYISIPGELSDEDADAIVNMWTARHGGLANKGKPGVLFNSAEWKPTGMTLQDAQFIESQRFSVEEAARIMFVPPEFLAMSQSARPVPPEQESLKFLTWYLNLRLRRIEDAFAADSDLFAGTTLLPSFDVGSLLRADLQTQSAADKSDVQAGILLVDEVRARRGLPPLPNGAGQVPQITPVGGAPNPDPIPAEEDGGLPAPGDAGGVADRGREVIVVNLPAESRSNDTDGGGLSPEVLDALGSVAKSFERMADKETTVYVNVDAPEQPEIRVSPEIHIDAPITLQVPKRTVKPIRDENGLVTRYEQEEV